MLYSLTYAVVRLLLKVLIVRGRPNATLRAEVLALRHQLRVLATTTTYSQPIPMAGPSW